MLTITFITSTLLGLLSGASIVTKNYMSGFVFLIAHIYLAVACIGHTH